MKRIAFLVLVFTATHQAPIAQEEDMPDWVEAFISDEKSATMCLKEAGTTEMEMEVRLKHFDKIQDDNIDDEAFKIVQKFSLFLACMMEKKGMMSGTELHVDKIMDAIEKDKNQILINKDMLKECLNSVNEEKSLRREDKIIGMIICYAVIENEEEKKK